MLSQQNFKILRNVIAFLVIFEQTLIKIFAPHSDRQTEIFYFQAPRKQKNKMNNKHSVKLLLLICIITYDKSIAQFNGGLKGDCEWTD